MKTKATTETKTILDLIDEYSEKAPVNVEAIIRGAGIDLDKKAHLDDAIAGEISLQSEGKYKISVNGSDHYYRKRFTMAHELGHFLFHADLIDAGVDDTKMYRSTEDGNFYNTKIKKQHETEANRFAAHILMPEELVEEKWSQGTTDMSELAKCFQVSKAAMKIRLKSMGLVDED